MASPAAVLNVLVTANTTQASAALTRLDRQMKSTAATANKTTSGSSGIGPVVAKGARTGALAIGALGIASVVTAAKFESAFAEVRKTVDATEPQFDKLERGIRRLATQIPISADELANLAGQAGALGIKAQDLLKFTRTAAELGITTDMSAEEAANALARLSNIMGTSSKDFRRLASTMVELGNSGASTESEIAEMALRIAGAGKVVGISEAKVLGFASALASVGIRAEAGGSAISRAFIEMADAVKEGGAQLDAFAKVAGVSSGRFQTMFNRDAAGAMVTFIEGLDRIRKNGGNVFQVLENLGLSEIRLRDALLRASGAGKLFREQLRIGSEEWRRNNALTTEAERRYATTAAQFQLLKNRVRELGIAFGSLLLPAVNKAMQFLGQTLPNWISNRAIPALRRFWKESALIRAAFKLIRSIVVEATKAMIQRLQGFAQSVRGIVKVISGVLTLNFGRAWSGVKDIFKGGAKQAVGAVRGMLVPIKIVLKAIVKAFNAVVHAVGRAIQWIIDKVNKAKDALGSIKPDISVPGLDIGNLLPGAGIMDAFQRGGRIRGHGSGDKVPAMLEPGEVVINRKAVKAMGGPNRVNQINQMIPRFATGGPVVRGHGGMQGIAQGATHTVWEAATRYLKKIGGVAGNWRSIDALARRLGLSVTSSFRPGDPGFHGRRQAKDYSDGYATPAELQFGKILARAPRKLLELIHTPLGFSVDNGRKVAPFAQADHFDHVHVALAQKYQKGGAIGKFGRPKHGLHWIHGGQSNSPGGRLWTMSEAATLLWQVGMSPSDAKRLARKVPGESGGNPRAHGPPDGRGLWQIERQFHPEFRNWNLWNPILNARAAKRVYEKQGLGAWYAASSSGPVHILKNMVGRSRRKPGVKGGLGGMPRIIGHGIGSPVHSSSFSAIAGPSEEWFNLMRELGANANLRTAVSHAQAPVLGIPPQVFAGPTNPGDQAFGVNIDSIIIHPDGTATVTSGANTVEASVKKVLRAEARRGRIPMPGRAGALK